jgi:hypothetical protein
MLPLAEKEPEGRADRFTTLAELMPGPILFFVDATDDLILIEPLEESPIFLTPFLVSLVLLLDY